jgi:hypothetical protein
MIGDNDAQKARRRKERSCEKEVVQAGVITVHVLRGRRFVGIASYGRQSRDPDDHE